MNNIDLFEIEHKVHQWITQLSMAAAKQGWSITDNGVKKYGLGSDKKVMLGISISESILDERNDIPLQTKLSVWEHVFAQFSDEVTARDFPIAVQKTKNETSWSLDVNKISSYLLQLYEQELDVRNKINAAIAEKLQTNSKSLKM